MASDDQPKESWTFPGQHEYEGIVYSPAFPRESLEKCKQFQLHPQDVLMPNYPKSGIY